MSMRFKLPRVLSFRNPVPALALAATLLAGGCGVVSKDSLSIQTDPPDAFVYVNGRFVGNAPLNVRLNRQVPHRVEVRKAGFVTKEVTVYPSFTEGEEPGVVFGPLREAGYYRNLEPNPVEVEMLYTGLRGEGQTLTAEKAREILDRIQTEVDAGELTGPEATVAQEQVLRRVE